MVRWNPFLDIIQLDSAAISLYLNVSVCAKTHDQTNLTLICLKRKEEEEGVTMREKDQLTIVVCRWFVLICAFAVLNRHVLPSIKDGYYYRKPIIYNQSCLTQNNTTCFNKHSGLTPDGALMLSCFH